MKRYRITLGSHTFDVEILDNPCQERVQVQVNGETFTVGVEAIPTVAEGTAAEAAPATAPAVVEPAPSSTPAGAAATGRVVRAPLPGVIKSIATRPGQQVAANDELLVIEAMKMDNLIRAPRRGIIGTIYVAEGQQVAYGEPLLDLAD
jgi:biotin carboxyl carrier protein